MFVKKRDGSMEKVSFDKVLRRVENLSNDLNINVAEIAQKVCSRIYDGVGTSELDELTAQLCSSLIAEHLDYGVLSSRITISNHHKNTSPSFSEVMDTLYKQTPPLISEDVYDVVCAHKEKFNTYIEYSRDYSFDYFGFKTLERAYLMRVNGKITERPQHLFMRVSIGIHGNDLREVLDTYDAFSKKKFIHATPTLFNFGTPRPQGSSCFLMEMEDDSISGIYNTLKDTALISKYAGGIGVHIHNVRGKNSYIRGTNGYSDGIIPMLRVFNSTARYVNQCFTPDTVVYTKKGPKPISDIIVNSDQVITVDGTFRPVLQVISNDVNKPILEVRCTHSFEPITVTKEHEIYVLKNQQKGLNFNVIKNRLEKGLVTPKYVFAGELNPNDMVGFPKFKYPSENDMNNNPMNEIDSEFYRFYGIMLGDGHISKRNEEFGVSLNLESKLETVEFVESYLKKLNIHYWTSQQHNCHQIRFSKTPKINLARDDIYDDNDDKFIQQKYFNLNKFNTSQIVKGLIETDGSIGKEIYFSTSSVHLAYGIKYLCYKLNILTSGFIKNEIGKTHMIRPDEYITTKKLSYVIRIPKVDALRDLFENIETSTYVKYFEHNDMLWTRIKTIKETHYQGKVYDLNIEDNHNYTVSNLGLVHNSGRRNGSIAVYLEPWHCDVEGFLEMRKNHGNEEERARDLFYALWIPDLFMERVKNDEMWSLMCPDKCRGLSDVYGDEFNTMYCKYEQEGKYIKQIKAQSLWRRIIDSQIETGTPYMLYKDSVNKKTNHQNLGVIKSSNLCTEIMEYTSPEETAVCNLASMCLPTYVNSVTKKFDFEELHNNVKIVTKNLNKIIDKNFYPIEKTSLSNMRHRPIGIGVQGLADTFILMRYPFDSQEAKELNKQIFETIYHASLEASNEIAKKRAELFDKALIVDESSDEYKEIMVYLNLIEEEKSLTKYKGAYSSYEGSPISKGIYQYDMWNVKVTDDLWNWTELHEKINKWGVRNSLLLAPMPTASTSQIMGFNECFEPFTSNLYKRKTLAGEFIVINKYLLNDLIENKLWNKDLKDKLIVSEGSIQHIDELPSDMKDLYKTAWEIKQKTIIDMAVDRGAYICQSQSMNLFTDDPDHRRLTTMHFYAWQKGLKTGMYYLRTKPKANTQQFTIDPTKAKSNIVTQNSVETECLTCSA